MSNIQGYLEALIDDVVPASRETFELLHDETLRLTHLVEDILHLAKADAARETLDLMDIRIGDVIERVLDVFRTQFETKRIDVDSTGVDDASYPQSDAKCISVHNFRRNGQNNYAIDESRHSSCFCQYRC